MTMHDEAYSVRDLVMNPSFVRWVKHQDAEAGKYWVDWLRRHPDKQGILNEARQLVIGFSTPPETFDGPELEAMWQHIQARTSQLEPLPAPQPVFWKNARRWAAVFIGLLLTMATVYFLVRPANVTEHTAYGEVRRVKLPDGSIVTLNANSTIRYEKEWDSGQPRQVWLAGEAFFQVTHTSTHQKFLVHTGDLQVEVLGTSFNVWQRGPQTKIVLSTGKVKLDFQDRKEPVIMQPGEMVAVRKGQPAITRRTVNPQLYTAWREHKLIFRETPLGDVIELIRHTYGYRVKVTDPGLLAKKITSRVMHDDLDLLLELLAESLDAEIRKTDRTIVIETLDHTP